MDAPIFQRTLTTLGQLAEIHSHINRGGIETDELLTANRKLELTMAKMLNALLETEGQIA